MCTMRWWVALAALCACFAQHAAAQLLVPLADGRYAFVDHCPMFDPCESESATPPVAFAPFDAEVSHAGMSALQRSTLETDDTRGTLEGALSVGSPDPPPPGNTTGEAVFDIRFDAGDAASWTWSAAGEISGGGYGGAFLVDETRGEVLAEASLPATLDLSGALEAGHRYRLYHHATALNQGSASWDFRFAVAPEPGVAGSLPCGALLAVGLARRRRTARWR